MIFAIPIFSRLSIFTFTAVIILARDNTNASMQVCKFARIQVSVHNVNAIKAMGDVAYNVLFPPVDSWMNRDGIPTKGIRKNMINADKGGVGEASEGRPLPLYSH